MHALIQTWQPYSIYYFFNHKGGMMQKWPLPLLLNLNQHQLIWQVRMCYFSLIRLLLPILSFLVLQLLHVLVLWCNDFIIHFCYAFIILWYSVYVGYRKYSIFICTLYYTTIVDIKVWELLGIYKHFPICIFFFIDTSCTCTLPEFWLVVSSWHLYFIFF